MNACMGACFRFVFENKKNSVIRKEKPERAGKVTGCSTTKAEECRWGHATTADRALFCGRCYLLHPKAIFSTERKLIFS